MSRILITGAGGFVGSALGAAAEAEGLELVRVSRRAAPGRRRQFSVGDLGPTTDWTTALEGVDIVVHLAARTHVMRESGADPLSEYRRVNVDATRRLATQAAAAGIGRLVFVSSIKVNGERTAGTPFRESDPPRPEDAYGRTKLEAETVIREVAGSGMEFVIVRPALVYGPEVRGNLLRLLGAIARGIPLPLGRVQNRRSLVGVDNLASLLLAAARHPAAAGQILLAADQPAISTPDLVRILARGLGVPCRLLPVPVAALRGVLALLGQRDAARRLTDSLEVDASLAERVLGWTPPRGLETGLVAMARWYRDMMSPR